MTAVYFLYAVAVLSIIAALFFIGVFFARFWNPRRQKINRMILFAVDAIFAVAWGVLVIILIAQFHCGIGTRNGW